uniref:Uncharacterized protein n=1 Tax=Solanum lycopersicum TaxID=4081 RepID=A0A3Q7JAP0_SOLLC
MELPISLKNHFHFFLFCSSSSLVAALIFRLVQVENKSLASKLCKFLVAEPEKMRWSFNHQFSLLDGRHHYTFGLLLSSFVVHVSLSVG